MLEETEAALLARVRELFGATLRQVEPLTGTWTNEDVHRLFLAPPSVFLAWMGCGEGRTRREVESRWAFFVVAELLNGEPVNRPGIYQIVERLIAGVNGQTFGP
ncbi:TPA: phage protein Gp37, partial [Escherichia coli]